MYGIYEHEVAIKINKPWNFDLNDQLFLDDMRYISKTVEQCI